MRKSSLLLAAGVVALAASAPAQLDFEVVFDQADALAARGGSGQEFDGVAVAPDGSEIFIFDSPGSFDGVLRYTAAADNGTPGAGLVPLLLDNGGGGAPTYATHIPGFGTSASATDIAVSGDGTLYQIVRSGTQNMIRVTDASLPVPVDLLFT